MNKISLKVIIGICVFLVMMGCTLPQSPGEGSLQLTINNGINSKTLTPDLDINPASYRITGAGPEGATFDLNSTTGDITIGFLRFGDWIINIEAFNAEGVLIAAGSADAAVHVGDVTPVVVTIRLLDGMGGLNLDLSWPANEVENPNISGILKSAAINDIELDFLDTGIEENSNLETRTAFTGNTVPMGYYTLVVKVHDLGVSGTANHLALGAVEIVRILKDQITFGSYNLSGVPGMGKIDVKIVQDFDDPIEVSILGDDGNSTLPKSTAFNNSELITVSAAVPDTDEDVGNITYLWYLNGETIGVDQNITLDMDNSPLSTTIDGKFLPGRYRLDVTAFNTDGSRAGSAKYEFDVTGNPAAAIVDIPNPNLEMIIRQSLAKPEGEIYSTDMESILYLNLEATYDFNITSLDGLEYCTNLIYLNINYNHLTDISTVAFMKNLEVLELMNNKISDISMLAGLTKLKRLNLGGNKVTDISALKDLTSLENLDLLYNRDITDFSSLAGLTNIDTINLGGTGFSDTSLLSGMTKLQIAALFYNPELSDLSGLEGLPELWHLPLDGCSVSDVTPFLNMPKIKSVQLGNNNVSDISSLANMTQLESAILNNNNITDFSPLMGLENVRSLNASYNGITDISFLTDSNIMGLNLQGNSIVDISPLTSMMNLKNAYLSENNMTIKDDGAQGTINLNVINELKARNVYLEYERGNSVE